MSLAIIYSRADAGVHAPLVTVEAHISYGMAGFYIVGLPEKAVRESKDRIRSAFMNAQLEFPARRITINLAPADLPKEGGRFDLPIALGILAASDQLPIEQLNEYEFVGELALSGELRALRGMLPVVLSTHQAGRRLIIPEQNAAEAALVQQATIYSARSLIDVCAHLRGVQLLPRCQSLTQPVAVPSGVDIADVKGQAQAKRALEIAAAGQHNLLFIGPPGTGKTMLASRLPTLLPPMKEDEALEAAAIASVSQSGFHPANWRATPFRAPHHSSSCAALVGGGRPPQPGEISLAHRGVLFLDELPEFNRYALDSLREPLESGVVTISRAAYQRHFPAQFQLIAAMNPCPCGYAGSTMQFCQCTSEQVRRYRSKLSGPLLDRFDMQVEVAALSPEWLTKPNDVTSDTSDVVRERVISARAVQLRRQGKLNFALSVPELEKMAALSSEAQAIIQQAMLKFNLSARVYHRIVKVARTIADLGKCENIRIEHVAEALRCRLLDRVSKSAL